MSDSHSEKYFAKLLIGFGAIISSVVVTFYAVFETGAQKGDWYFWAVVAAFLMCSGVYFSLTAFVHKVKSDFNKRSKQREMQKDKLSS
jgi:hypothetical protein